MDDEAMSHVVVVNGANQHALWPWLVDIPDGWTIVFGPAGRADCVAYADRSWTDMRPARPGDTMAAAHRP